MLDKKRKNLLIILLSAIVLLVSIYYFFLGIQFQETGTLPKIGEVFKKDNDLRRKVDGSLSWIDIEHSAKIFPGDKVFTGAASLAQLNLLDLAEIGMNSSTLLRIDPKTLDSLSLQGGLGFFTAKLSGKMNQASIAFKNANLNLNGTGTEIHVNGFEDKMMIASMNGKVSFQTLGPGGQPGIQTLAPNQLLGMNRQGVPTVINLPAKLISPLTAEEVVVKPKVPVSFKWQTLIPEAVLLLELSKVPTFDHVMISQDVTGKNEVQLDMDSQNQGVLYWRIVEKGKSEYYHAQQFQYQPLEPPVIYSPVQRQNYRVVNPKAPEFNWEKKFDFSYEGEIQQLDGGIQGAQKFKSTSPSYLTRGLVDGHYQFRIRAMKGPAATEWSEWTLFSVGDVEKDEVELLSPPDLAQATLIFPEKEVKFEWTANAARSLVQISKDEKFKQVILETVTEKKMLRWKPLLPGKYYWRVRSGVDSKPGMVRSFMVAEPRLALLSPKENSEYLYRDEGFENIRFTWEDVSLNDQYVFELSNSPGFKKIYERSSLSKNEYELKFPKRKEVLYWRVKTAFQSSPIRKFKISPLPNLIAPTIELARLQIQEENTVFGGVTDRNPTQLGPDFVELFLPRIGNAVSYRMEVFRDSRAQNLLMSKTLKSPLFRWNDPEAGEYYWRISYWDKDGNQSPMSAMAPLIIEPKEKKVDTNPFTRVPY